MKFRSPIKINNQLGDDISKIDVQNENEGSRHTRGYKLIYIMLKIRNKTIFNLTFRK